MRSATKEYRRGRRQRLPDHQRREEGRDLRQTIHPDVDSRIFAEIDKNPTQPPITDIERHLVSELQL